MGLPQVLQLIQNKVHPSQRGGVPIMKTFRRESTGIQDVPAIPMDTTVQMDAGQVSPVAIEPQAPSMPFVTRKAPSLNTDKSNELFNRAREILSGIGDDPAPQIKAPNNESIALALLPALFGANPAYLNSLGQGYMAGQNNELARIDEERRRRQQNILRQAQSVQGQGDTMFDIEKAIYNQDSLNYRNEQDNDRMLTNTGIVQDELNKRFGIGDKTKRDLAADDNKIDVMEIQERRLANDRVAWYNEVKYVNMDGSVTQKDINILTERAKKISPDFWQYLPMPVIGTAWNAAKAEADTRLNQKKFEAQQRANDAKAENPGRGGRGSGAPKPLGGKLGADDGMPLTEKEARRRAAVAQGAINTLRAKQKVEGDLRKRARYEIDIVGLAATRDYYAGMLKGGYVPMNPGAPGGNPSPPPTAPPLVGPVQPKTSGGGIPAADSHAQGGTGKATDAILNAQPPTQQATPGVIGKRTYTPKAKG